MQPAERSGAIAMLQMSLSSVPPTKRRSAAISLLLREQLFLDDAARMELIRELKDPKSEASQRLIIHSSRSLATSDVRDPGAKFLWMILFVVAGLAYWLKDILFLGYAILLAVLKSMF